MEKTCCNHTPYSTARLFIPIDKIKRTDKMFKLLDEMSIWGGCDSYNDEYYSWEFSFDDIKFVQSVVSVYQ